ncbi:hypothetical protein ACFX1Q_008360 [Malus domestica]
MARKLVKQSQKKQSFYTILLSDYARHLRIPPKFVKNFNGWSPCKCVLRGPSGLRRTVELEERNNGLFFNVGWQYFVKDHHLENGDLLVFKYDGESKFKVAIYDTTACEKDVEIADSWRIRSSVPLFNNGHARVKEEIVELETENYNENCENKVFISGRKKWNHLISGKIPSHDQREATSTQPVLSKSKNSCFIAIFNNPRRYRATIPRKLAVAEDVLNKKSIMIQDSTGRSWLVKLNVRGKGSQCRVDMATGLGECGKANQVLPGDEVVFEFVKQSLLQIHIYRVEALGGKSLRLLPRNVRENEP